MENECRGINLKSAGRPATFDLFEYAHRADGVVNLLTECSTPFVVSVEGEWGRGKSTFVEMVIKKLDASFNGQVVRYHPWRFDLRDFEDAWESLVAVLSRDLKNTTDPKPELDRLANLAAHSTWLRLLWRVGGPLLNVFAPRTQQVTEGLAQVAKGLIEYFETPEKLGERYAIFEKVRAELCALAHEHRILLVIDDLDRCEPSAIAHVLRCIPTLFAPRQEGPNYVLLLGMDRNATTRALVDNLGWDGEYVAGYLDKVINVHVTLPTLQLGSGSRKDASKRVNSAIRGGGKRQSRQVALPDDVRGGSDALRDELTKNNLSTHFEIPEDRCQVIAKFMHFNPRELERFCILFDLKWDSRLLANALASIPKAGSEQEQFDFDAWLRRFADRLIWESIVELRWPLYDSKTADDRTNAEAIDAAIKGDLKQSEGLACEEFVKDQDFLEIREVYVEWSKPGRQLETR